MGTTYAQDKEDKSGPVARAWNSNLHAELQGWTRDLLIEREALALA